MSSFHIISRLIMSSLFVLSLGFVPYWICRYMSSSISPLGYVFIYLSWICRGVSLSASSGLDKVFCRGCAFLLGYLISFCLLGIMNHFYALIHRYIYIYISKFIKNRKTIPNVLISVYISTPKWPSQHQMLSIHDKSICF